MCWVIDPCRSSLKLIITNNLNLRIGKNLILVNVHFITEYWCLYFLYDFFYIFFIKPFVKIVQTIMERNGSLKVIYLALMCFLFFALY